MDFLEMLGKRRVLFDGAMGSELMARGLGPDEAPESWNENRPDVVRAIHRAYLEAGADVVETNTFGGTRIRLGERGLAQRAAELNRLGAQLAVSVKAEGSFVAGSIGPTGKLLRPLGDLEERHFVEAFAEQAQALEQGGCNFVVIETMYDLREALCALRGVREGCSLPVGVTLTFERKRRGFFTMMGTSVSQFIRMLEAEEVAFLGANCTLGSDEMVDLAREIRDSTTLPVLIQPNAGHPVAKGGTIVYPIGPEEFAGHVRRIAELGVEMLGGCCGTTPAYVREMRRALEEV